jgi:hypothetical protein
VEKDEDEVERDRLSFPPLGLAVIVEAEEISTSMESPSSIHHSINQIVEKLGLVQITEPLTTPLEYEGAGFENGFATTFIFSEGTITARCFLHVHYCGFDIHFWDQVDNAETVKDELLKAVGTTLPSVYRILTAGMPSEVANDKIGPRPANRFGKDSTDSDASPMTASSSFVEKADPIVNFRNSTLHAYDNREALVQWLSQRTIGYQKISKFLVDPRLRPNDVPYRLVKMLNWTLHLALAEELAPKGLEISKYKIGHGGLVFTVSWSLGNIMVVYDGVSRVDVNHFVIEAERSYDLHAILETVFEGWPVVACDDFPRGVGLVVNFSEDYHEDRERGERPYWA